MTHIKFFKKKNNNFDNFERKNIFSLIDFPEKVNGGSITYAILLNKGISKFKKNIKIIRPPKSAKGFIYKYSRIYNLFIYLLKILKLNHNSNASIFISHHPISALFLLIFKNKSTYYICHGPWSDEYSDINKKNFFHKLNYRLRDLIQFYVLKNSKKVFFVSEYMFNNLNSKYQGELQNIIVQILGPIIDISQFHLTSMNRGGNNGVIIRRLVPRTGVLDLLIKLQDAKLSIDIDIIGVGDQIHEIRKLSKTAISKVFIRGKLSDKDRNKFFTNSIVCILPSISLEGFGLVILEAINFGCIPIVSNMAGGGKDWLIKHDENLIYDGSIKDLNRAIKYASKNYFYLIKILRKEIKKFNPEIVAKNLLFK